MALTDQFFTVNQKEQLLEIFKIFAPTYQEVDLVDYVEEELKKIGISYTRDEYNNIYNFDNIGMPLLSAHMDCVGDANDGAYVAFTNIIPYGADEILKGMGNIGGDDKCGVFLILQALAEIPNLNFCFSVEEERGGLNGIKKIPVPDVENIPYALVLDRRNNGDIICLQNSYGVKEFEEELALIGKDFNFKPERGSCSDANTISQHMSCANLSVAYHNPHTKKEFVSISNLANVYNYIKAVINGLQGKTFKVPTVTYHNPAKYAAFTQGTVWCSGCKLYVKSEDFDHTKRLCKSCTEDTGTLIEIV